MAKVFKDPGPARKAEWLREHPGDEGRFVAAFSEEAGGSSAPSPQSAPKPATSIPQASSPAAPSAGASVMPPSVQGIAKVAAPAPESAPATLDPSGLGLGGGGGVGAVLGTAPGMLRGLGRRMPAQEGMSLAALQRRIY